MVSGVARRAQALRPAVRIAAAYLAFGALWIWFSDAWLAAWVPAEDLTRFQTWKGWLYVAVTALLVWWLVWRRLLAGAELAEQAERAGLRMRAVFDTVYDALLILDADSGTVVDANARACKMLGLERARLLCLDFTALSADQPPCTPQAAAALFRQAAQGAPQRAEWPLRHAAGHAVWVEFSLRRTTQEQHDFVVAAARDASERRATRQAQERDRIASERARALLQRVIDATPDWIFVRDAEQRYLLANQGYAQALGLAPADLLGRRDAELWASRPGEAAGWSALCPGGSDAAVLHAGTCHRLSETVTLPDGRRRVLDLLKLPIADEADQPAVFSYVRDVSRQVGMEARYRMLFDQVPVAAWVYDPRSLRFLEVNRAAEDLYGYSRAEFLAMAVTDLAEPAEAEPYQASLRDVRGPVMRLGRRHRRRDGSQLLVDLFADDFEEIDGRRIRVVTVRDVTAQRRIELERDRLLQQLRELSRRLVRTQEDERRYLSRELHDQIGQQLAALKLNLATLSHRSGPEVPRERLRDCIDIVDTTLAQIRDRAMNLRPPMLDDMGLAAAIEWYCRRQHERSRCQVSCELGKLPPGLREELEISAFRIVQEAVNNALRHSDATRIDVTVDAAPPWLRLRVADNGQGMTEDTSHSVHQGLGIAGMRERVEWLAGRFELRSQPGGGTVVQAALPLVAVEGALP